MNQLHVLSLVTVGSSGDVKSMDSVLVGVVYTDYKLYCRPLMPDIYNRLSYVNKELYFVDEKSFPDLKHYKIGEMVAAYGRNEIIRKARKENFDWVFFLDIDTIPDKDAIEKLLSVNHPLVGGLHTGRGLPYSIIGHNYSPPASLDRVSIDVGEGRGVIDVDGTSGGVLLVNKSIFTKVDYSNYMGPNTIPLRFTADDEFLQIKIRNMLHIKPKLNLDCKSWHLSDDCLAYQWYGHKEVYYRGENYIKFKEETFCEQNC